MKRIIVAAATLITALGGSAFMKAHHTSDVWFLLDSNGNPVTTVKPTVTQPTCDAPHVNFCAREYTSYTTIPGTSPVEYSPGSAVPGTTLLRN